MKWLLVLKKSEIRLQRKKDKVRESERQTEKERDGDQPKINEKLMKFILCKVGRTEIN